MQVKEEVAFSTLVELVRERAAEFPDHIVYTYLADGEDKEEHLTFAQLDQRAKEVAAVLQAKGKSGDRAMLLYPSSLDYIIAFFGCLYAGVIAVPAYPPHPKKPMHRLVSILQNAEPTMVLTNKDLFHKLEARRTGDLDFSGLTWVATDEENFAAGLEWTEPDIDANSLAFLQYTSGSTSAPKGVMLTHGNLLHNLSCIQVAFEVRYKMNMLTWLPPFHDMGLIGALMMPITRVAHCVMMAPFDFLQKPLRLLKAASKYKAHGFGGPNFAYDLMASKVKPEQMADLDLSQWEVAYNGAEPVRMETLRRFAEHFAPAGVNPNALAPCYGLAEGTLMVTAKPIRTAALSRTFDVEALQRNLAVEVAEGEGRELVSSGRPTNEQKVYIVNPDTCERLSEGQVGEIWVQSPSVAQGYWRMEEVTEKTFRATLADEEGYFLRTGDLGFQLEGELYVTGRNKDLIIVSGRNYYPQDIELTVETAVPAVRSGCSAAFSVDINGEERLILTAELDRHFRAQDTPEKTEAALKEVKAQIRRAVSEAHEVMLYDIVLLKYGAIPKTSSGKIQRHASKNGYVNKSLDLWGV